MASRSVGGSSAAPVRLAARRPVGRRRHRAAFGRIHGHREQSQAFDLHQGRRAIGDLQHALDHFAGAAAGFIRKLRHTRLALALKHES